jgi:SAM-dependent methyltransferase
VALQFYKSTPDQIAFGVVPAYRRFELYQARYHELVPIVGEQIGSNPQPIEVLDIGSGHGPAKQFVDRLAGHARWTGIEIHDGRAAECRALGYDSVVTSLDLEKDRLPFKDGQFQVVIASHVLEHLTNAPQALADWYRVVAPGGALLLGVPMHLAPIALLARLKYRWWGRRPRQHCQFWSMGSLRRFLAPWPVQRIWGFRVLSARRQLPLEDWEWFYRASVWLGARMPSITSEVNVHIAKPLA